MAYTPQMYLELENIEIPARDGGEFDVRKFTVMEGRGFLEMLHFGVGSGDKSLLVYEILPFSLSDFDGAALLSHKIRILIDGYLHGLQAAGLEEERLVALNTSLEHTAARLIGMKEPNNMPAAQGEGHHKTVIGHFQKNNGPA